MVTLPLGQGAYRRSAGAEPQIRLVNRYVELDPGNLREHTTLLARRGSTDLHDFSDSPNRGNFSKRGLFSSDLFVANGATLYRYSAAHGATTIAGTLRGSGNPYVTWMKGIGYEYLFITDGVLLQYYDGGTHAQGTLTLSGGGITSQIIEIGGVYYQWTNGSVDTGSPAGTSAAPYLVKRGATDSDSLAAMANALNFYGVPGTDFSTAIPGPAAGIAATSTSTTLVITSDSAFADGNAITTSVFSGSFLAWGGATLSGGNVHKLTVIPVPDGQVVKALTSVSGYVLLSIGDSQKFYWINPGETTIDPLNFAEKESNPDNIVDMLTVGDQAVIMGDGSTENWYATGDFSAPFLPQEGRVYRRGVVEGTPVVVRDSIIAVGDDGIVYEIGYSFGGEAQWGVKRISDHGIEERIRAQLRREEGEPA